ncbi:MAG: acetylornithine/succinylornithine family transaminase [Streptococcaceae bacterium]|jgi:acetylornithine aminotransferase|nr:acetylornithine/succinylornithine family transaminase [Streptococcaceae bacterium]
MSHLFNNYGRSTIEFVRGEDVYLFDTNGDKYLDLTSGIGVTNFGYSFQAAKDAIKSQAETLIHIPNLYQNSLQEEVAKLIGGDDYIGLFVNSGAEANEAAIKFARLKTGKSEIITFKNSFHGRTYGAMSATGQEKIQKGFAPLVPGFKYAEFNQLETVKALVTEDTAAIMLEIIQGEGGVLPAEVLFITALAEFASAKGILLIIDEVQTGIARTGRRFAFEHFGIKPDVFTLAKGLANGVPVGAMFAKREYADVLGPGTHGSTFGGNKLAMVSAKAVLEGLTAECLAHITKMGEFATTYLRLQLTGNELVEKIQGIGLMQGIVLTKSELVADIIEQLQAEKILVLRAGDNVIRLLPPLIITQEQLAYGLAKIVEILNKKENC